MQLVAVPDGLLGHAPLERDVLPGHARPAPEVQQALAQPVAVPDGLLGHAPLERDVLPEHARPAPEVQQALAQPVADGLLGHAPLERDGLPEHARRAPDVQPALAQPVAVPGGQQVARVLRRAQQLWPARLSPALPFSVPVHSRSAVLPPLPELKLQPAAKFLS